MGKYATETFYGTVPPKTLVHLKLLSTLSVLKTARTPIFWWWNTFKKTGENIHLYYKTYGRTSLFFYHLLMTVIVTHTLSFDVSTFMCYCMPLVHGKRHVILFPCFSTLNFHTCPNKRPIYVRKNEDKIRWNY